MEKGVKSAVSAVREVCNELPRLVKDSSPAEKKAGDSGLQQLKRPVQLLVRGVEMR
jgi:hypothetical protein